MKSLLCGLASGLVLTGCASTPSRVEPTVFSGFLTTEEGDAIQAMRGFNCPAEIGDLLLAAAEILADDGSDAYCNYVSGSDRAFTVYLSDFPSYSFSDYYQSSLQEVGTAMTQAGLDYDSELSDICERSSFDEMSILQAFSKMKDSEILLSQDPASVFTGPNKLSILTISDLGDRRYLKFRFTLAGSGEADVKPACDFIRSRSVQHQAQISAASGELSSEDEMLGQFLKNLATEGDAENDSGT